MPVSESVTRNELNALPGASILRGLGEQSPTFLKVGGLTDWSIVLHILNRLLLFVAFGIPVMTIDNRDYMKLVLGPTVHSSLLSIF